MPSANGDPPPGTPAHRDAPRQILLRTRRGAPPLALATVDGSPVRPPSKGRPGRLIWLLIALIAAGAVVVTTVMTGGSATRRTLVVTSTPYWNITHAASAVLANRQAVNEVSPWMYGLASDGQIDTQYGHGQAAAVTRDLTRLRAKGLRIVPTIANITAGSWSYQPVARMLHSPRLMDQHVAAIVALVSSHGYAGIDIDYEELHAADRQAFTRFVTHLALALHARHKVLSVALFAKTTNAGYAPRNVAQDYVAIGRVADQVRLMAYDYHWASSAPGPVAPVRWVSAVLRYATTQIPAAKIILGVPLYGYDWSGGHGTALSWLQAFRLSRQYHAAAHYDTAAQSPWFSYTDGSGHQHTVWFENAESSKAKFGLAQGSRIGGVYLWMYGYEDTGTWSVLRHILPISGPHALTTSTAAQ